MIPFNRVDFSLIVPFVLYTLSEYATVSTGTLFSPLYTTVVKSESIAGQMEYRTRVTRSCHPEKENANFTLSFISIK